MRISFLKLATVVFLAIAARAPINAALIDWTNEFGGKLETEFIFQTRGSAVREEVLSPGIKNAMPKTVFLYDLNGEDMTTLIQQNHTYATGKRRVSQMARKAEGATLAPTGKKQSLFGLEAQEFLYVHGNKRELVWATAKIPELPEEMLPIHKRIRPELHERSLVPLKITDVDEAGLPVQGGETMAVVKLDLSDQPESLFKVPSDYQRIGLAPLK